MEEAKAEMDIAVMTTDGHLGIASHMRNHELITHNLVSYHVADASSTISCYYVPQNCELL